jgi:hypothetical protein
MGKLTALQVSRTDKRGLYNDGDGLYLQVGASNQKSWIFRYRKDGRLRDHGLGSARTLSLSEAREAARECRKMRLQGIDPIEAKKQQRTVIKLEAAKSITFADCAEKYIATHRSGWKNAKHAGQWTATLSTYVYPVFGALPVAEIDVTLVLKAIEPIWTTKAETASRVRGRIEAVLDWAKVRGYRTGENPALWKGNLSHLLPARNKVKKVVHHAALIAYSNAAMLKYVGNESLGIIVLKYLSSNGSSECVRFCLADVLEGTGERKGTHGKWGLKKKYPENSPTKKLVWSRWNT